MLFPYVFAFPTTKIRAPYSGSSGDNVALHIPGPLQASKYTTAPLLPRAATTSTLQSLAAAVTETTAATEAAGLYNSNKKHNKHNTTIPNAPSPPPPKEWKKKQEPPFFLYISFDLHSFMTPSEQKNNHPLYASCNHFMGAELWGLVSHNVVCPLACLLYLKNK